jgi:hypothetical protein
MDFGVLMTCLKAGTSARKRLRFCLSVHVHSRSARLGKVVEAFMVCRLIACTGSACTRPGGVGELRFGLIPSRSQAADAPSKATGTLASLGGGLRSRQRSRTFAFGKRCARFETQKQAALGHFGEMTVRLSHFRRTANGGRTTWVILPLRQRSDLPQRTPGFAHSTSTPVGHQ